MQSVIAAVIRKSTSEIVNVADTGSRMIARIVIAISNPIAVSAENAAQIYGIDSGFVENPMIPSAAYRASAKKLHFVVPAVRCTFSNSSHRVWNPTQSNSPFENRLRSLISATVCAILRRIMRKSRSPDFICTSEILLANR